MKDIGIMLAVGLVAVSCVAIGAYLVMHGHPWFGLLAMLIGGGASYKSGGSDD